MTSKSLTILKLKHIKPKLYDKYSVKEIGLFGSFADNTQTENSDIDLLYETIKLASS